MSAAPPTVPAFLPGSYKTDLKPVWCAGCGDFGVLTALYRAMAVGAISIVTPIAATSAIVPVVVGFAHGDRPSSVQDAGIVLAFVGVTLASREEVHEARTDTRIAAGVGLALFSALCFGSSLVGLHAAAASGGDALWGTMMLRVAGILVATVFVWRRGRGCAGGAASSCGSRRSGSSTRPECSRSRSRRRAA